MRNCKNSIAAGLLFAVLMGQFFVVEAGAKEYSLSDLFRLALNSERIRIAEEQVKISQSGMKKARAALMPRLSGSAGITRFSESKTLGPAMVIQPETAASWGIRLEQSLSLGGREFASLNVSREDIARSKQELQAITEEYLLEVAKSYFDIHKAQASLAIAGTNLERLARHRDATLRRLKIGDLTRTALLRAEGEFSGAQSDYLRAKNWLDMSRNYLIRLLGLERDFKLTAPGHVAPKVITLEEAKEKALRERAEIKGLELQKKMAEEQIRLAQAAFWPNVSLSVGYLGSDQHPAAATINRESMSANVNLSYPFYDGGMRRAEVAAARARSRQLNLNIKDLRKAISTEVEGIYLDISTQRGIIDFHQNQLLFARDNYLAISRQFELGLANAIDVIDANVLLISAETKLVDARYSYQFYLLKLKRAMGISLQEK